MLRYIREFIGFRLIRNSVYLLRNENDVSRQATSGGLVVQQTQCTKPVLISLSSVARHTSYSIASPATSMADAKNDVEAQGGRRISAWRIALKSFTTQVSGTHVAQKNYVVSFKNKTNTIQWFLIPQGTGILSVILHQLHYQFHGLAIISQIFWLITIVTLVGFLLIYILRIIIFPRHVAYQLSHNIMETCCLSSISIAFTTIIQMMALNLTSDWGKGWGFAAWVLWWINATMAFLACVGIPYVFTKLEGAGIDFLPPGVLLPLIAALTAAAGGGVVCRYGELSATLQVPVIIVSYLVSGPPCRIGYTVLHTDEIPSRSSSAWPYRSQ